MSQDSDRTASLMTPARLAQLKARPAAAASPAAWLDQLASDAGSGHVRHLLDLRRQLEAQLRDADAAPLAAALAGFVGALSQVDFSLLQPKGWFARATGKGKESASAFSTRVEHGVRAGEELAEEVRKCQWRQQAQGTAADRTALEMDVELRAIEKIMDQGARWLQDMRGHLKAREAAGGDAATLRKIEEDQRRCELLVARLKQLRGASGAAQEVLESCRAASARRAKLGDALHQLLDAEWKPAQRRLAAFADEARTHGSVDEDVEPARAALAKLTEALRPFAADCEALQGHERATTAAVAALLPALQAAA
jgi:hypothetical protein